MNFDPKIVQKALMTAKSIASQVSQSVPYKAIGGIEEIHRREAKHFENGGEIDPPQKTVKAYKLFRTNPKRPNEIFPLFVNADTSVPIGKWIPAESGPKGKAEGKVKSKLGDLAYRPGWHSGDVPAAPHIGEGGQPPKYRPNNHVWAEVEVPDDVDWQSVANSRAQIAKSGEPIARTAHITDQVPVGGFYRYKTNPNMLGNWLISGSMKVNRLLSDDDVKKINDANGVADLPRRHAKYESGGAGNFDTSNPDPTKASGGYVHRETGGEVDDPLKINSSENELIRRQSELQSKYKDFYDNPYYKIKNEFLANAGNYRGTQKWASNFLNKSKDKNISNSEHNDYLHKIILDKVHPHLEKAGFPEVHNPNFSLAVENSARHMSGHPLVDYVHKNTGGEVDVKRIGKAIGGKVGSTLDENGVPDFTPLKLRGTQITKEPGGQWLGGSVEEALSPLRKEVGLVAPEEILSVPDEVPHDIVQRAHRAKAVNDFVGKQLTRYVKNDMGTEGDPIRALAENGVTHFPDKTELEEEIYPSGKNAIQQKRKKFKYPEKGFGKSNLAKGWEFRSDKEVSSHHASNFQDKMVDFDNVNDLLEKNSWINKLDSKTPIHGYYNANYKDLGFDHLVDELHNSVNPESGLPNHLQLRPESLSRMSVPQAVQHVHNINKWREDNRAEANKKLAFNPATFLHKDYPDSDYAWYQIRLPDMTDEEKSVVENNDIDEDDYPQSIKDKGRALDEALKYEGDTMGHCVGGYSEDVASGESKIYSLRNKKTGAPHVTIESNPSSDKDIPDSISQIKGKGNAKPVDRYLPYVQDFVKSGNWNRVGDLQNTGLRRMDELYSGLTDRMKEAGEHIPKYMTEEDFHAAQKRHFPHAATGGAIIAKAYGGPIDPQKAIRRALMVAKGMKRGGHKDPKTSSIEDWKWRSLKDVQAQLGDIKEIPSHVEKFGRFMDDTANKAGTVGLTPRDLIKAYTITRASIQRGAVNSDKVRAAGLDLPNYNEPKIRPEGAFGEWLHTPMGQRYLQHAEQGIVDPHSISNAVQIMAPFGRHTTDIPDALQWAAKNLPGREGDVSRLVAQAQQGASAPSEWRDLIKGVRGIGPSKAGFVASLLGRGDQPTLDARQIILHTGNPSKQAGPYIARRGGLGGEEAVERLAGRQRAMNLTTPSSLEPYYQHLAHHTIWDATGGDKTTHDDVIKAMQHAKDGGKINPNPLISHPLVKAMRTAGIPFPSEQNFNRGGTPKNKVKPPIYSSWDDVPTINPQNLVGKKIFPIRADLLKTGADYTGIDASQLTKPVAMRGGPGFPLIKENQRGGMGWAIKGKGRGTFKLNKDADYAAVTAMMPDTHESNSSFARALIGTMAAHARDKRIPEEKLNKIDNLIRAQSKNQKLSVLQDFPGFAHPEIHDYVDSLNFESRDRISKILHSATAQKLGAPNIKKIARETIDPQFSGLNRGDVMYLLELEKGDKGAVNLVDSGFTPHESYPLGIRGRIVGKFHHPFSAETLWKDWFDEKRAAKKSSGKSSDPAADTAHIMRGFDLALPIATVTQSIADNLPSRPIDIQSPQAARMALDVAHDRWMDTATPVGHGGVSPAEMSKALKNSEASSTLTQYSEKEIKDMAKKGKFRAFKLPSGDVYFGLKHGTNYEEEYGFKHPELTPNETALTSVVNNEPGAKGVGGASVMLKAIKEGATALDAYAVPSAKHPDGFLPSFYRQFGFRELGRIPFDPQYSTDQQVEDLKHHWRSTGWDESMGMPSVSIMKWDGKDEDRQDALRNYLAQSSSSSGDADDRPHVRSASRIAKQGTEISGGQTSVSGQGDGRGNRGGIRDDSQVRPPDRFTRTLTGTLNLNPVQAQSIGLSPDDIAAARKKLMFKSYGGLVDHALHITANMGRR
jgi:hypothetical protein